MVWLKFREHLIFSNIKYPHSYLKFNCMIETPTFLKYDQPKTFNVVAIHH